MFWGKQIRAGFQKTGGHELTEEMVGWRGREQKGGVISERNARKGKYRNRSWISLTGMGGAHRVRSNK